MNTRYGLYSFIFLLTASLLATLLASYTFTGEAGISRMPEKYPRAAQRLARWEPRWHQLRAVLQVLTVISQLASVSIMVIALSLPPAAFTPVLLPAGIYVVLYLFFMKILPMVLSESYADRITVNALPLVGFLAVVLIPISGPVAFLERRLLKHIISGSHEENRPSTEDEILSLVEQTNDKELDAEERDMIKSVFEFGETVTREIMTPRVDIAGIEDTQTIAGAIDLIKNTRHSRFPVYRETIDDVRGVVHVKDLLVALSSEDNKEHLKSLVKQVVFVPESMPINDLLQLLRSEQSQCAIVVDEYGGTAGLVTIEDIIEELVGDIEDEYDTQENKILPLSDGSSLVEARLSVSELNEALGLSVPEKDEYDSIGGYVFFQLGRIPLAGEVIEGEDHQITVQAASPRQIHKLRILKKSPTAIA